MRSCVVSHMSVANWHRKISTPWKCMPVENCKFTRANITLRASVGARQNDATGVSTGCVRVIVDGHDQNCFDCTAEIGIPAAPALVADSLTATSLSLEWKGVDIDRRAGGISYLVQWRYEELAETWQYCRNQSWGEGDQILVENLQPYTKYRVRKGRMITRFSIKPSLERSAAETDERRRNEQKR